MTNETKEKKEKEKEIYTYTDANNSDYFDIDCNGNRVCSIHLNVEEYDHIARPKAEQQAKRIVNALNEYPELKKIERDLFSNMQYYMEHCERVGYCTPQEWIENYKHF